MTNKKELKIIMLRLEITIKELAKAIGVSPTTLSYKINNKREFTSREIKLIQKALNLTNEQRDMIFFCNNCWLKINIDNLGGWING